MARLGRRERLEKRKRLEALAQLSLLRKEQARQESEMLRSLPKRERQMLTGNMPDYLGISKVGLLGRTHYAGCSAARGMSGQGSKALVAKAKAQKAKGQGPRFAPAFMAPGFEALKTESPDNQDVLIRVGTSPGHLIITDKIDPLTGKKIVLRVKEKGKYVTTDKLGVLKPKDGGKPF